MSAELTTLAIRAGQPSALGREAEAALCAHFSPMLRLFARRHLSDRAAAEDLVQDTLAAVVEAVRGGKADPERIGAFVYGVARNKRRERVRAEARARRAEQLPPSPPEQLPEAAALREHLFFCLSQLTGRARDVLARTYFVEERAPEIAEALGISVGNVRVIRHRSLAALRRCLGGGES